MPPSMRGDTSKMDQTKYCAFHRGLGHTTNDCTIWMKYFEKLVKKGKYYQYVDRPVAWPRKEADADTEPLAKTILINEIFAESEHLEATNSSKRGRSSRRNRSFMFKP
ncbi:hypothetical protein FF1_018677 [Malus domestica]